MTSVTDGIGEQRLERTEPGDLVGELLQQGVEPRTPASSGCSSRSSSPSALPQRVGVDAGVVDSLRRRGAGGRAA